MVLTPGWHSLSLCEVTWLCFQINFKLICVFSVWHVSFTWQFKITQGNTQPALRHNPAGQRPHRPFPSSFPQGLLLNSLKAKLKSFLLQELPLDPSPSDLIPPRQPSTPWVLSTFVILALTYQGLSSIKVIPCMRLSHGTLSFWRVETWFVFFPAGCGIQPDAMYVVGT